MQRHADMPALRQAVGLSLAEIGSMLSPNGAQKINRQLLAAKADEINQTVKPLRAVSRGYGMLRLAAHRQIALAAVPKRELQKFWHARSAERSRIWLHQPPLTAYGR